MTASSGKVNLVFTSTHNFFGANGAVVITGGALNANGGTITLNSNGGTVTQSGSIGGDETINSANGAVSIDTLDGDTDNTRSLTVNAGTATFTTTGAIGAIHPLKNLTISADDVALGGNLSGTGTLTIQPTSTTQGILIGSGYGGVTAGHLTLEATEVNDIQNGWSQINIGLASGSSGYMDISGSTWNDPVNFRGYDDRTRGNITGQGDATITFSPGYGVELDGVGNIISTQGHDINMGKIQGQYGTGVTINSNGGNIVIGWIQAQGPGATIGTDTITSGGGNIIIGNGTAAMLVGNATGGLYSIDAGAGTLAFNGTVNTVPDITATAGAITFNGAWGATTAPGNVSLTSTSAMALPAIKATNLYLNDTGAVTQTGALTLTGLSMSGTGGAYTLTNAGNAVGTIAGNTGSVNFSNGNTGFTVGTVNSINGLTSTGSDTLAAGTGTITTTQPIATGSGDLTLTADDMAIGGNLSGTGTLTIQPSTVTQGMYIGGSYSGTTAGVLTLSTAELGDIQNGWSQINLGRTNATGPYPSGYLFIGNSTWNDPVTFRGYDPLIMGAVAGQGDASITFTSTSGVTQLNSTSASVATQGRAITFNGTLGIYASNPSINSNGGTITVTSYISGSTAALGTVTIASGGGAINLPAIVAGTTVSGTYSIDAGTGSLTFGNKVNTPANVTANAGSISFNGVWGDSSAPGTVSLTSTSALALPAITAAHLYVNDTGAVTQTGALALTDLSMSGTGGAYTLTSAGNAVGTIAGNTGSVNFGNGNNGFTVGTVNSIAGLTTTGSDTLAAGTGTIATTAPIATGSGSLTLTADDMAIGGNLSGTGTLTIQPTSNAQVVRIGGSYSGSSAGSLTLSTAEIAYIQNGWSGIAIGHTSGTGDLDIGTSSWSAPITFRNGDRQQLVSGATLTTTNGASVTFQNGWVDDHGTISSAGAVAFNTTSNSVGGVISYGSSVTTANQNITFAQDVNMNGGDMTLNAGTGTITFTGVVNQQPWSMANNLTATAGTFSFGGALGNTNALGNVSLTSANSITLPSIHATSLGVTTGAGKSITVSGPLVMTGTTTTGNATFVTDDMAINADISGAGTITFGTATRFSSMGIGDGAAGAFGLSNAELDHILDGWSLISFGGGAANDMDITANAYTWRDNVRMGAAIGVITINGAQQFGSNSLTIGGRRAVNINAPVSGTGTLTFTPTGSSGVAMSIGDAAIATDNSSMTVSDASLQQIQDGWHEIDLTGISNGALYLGTAVAFQDPVVVTRAPGANPSFRLVSNLSAASGSNTNFTFQGTGAAGTIFAIGANIDTSLAASGSGAVTFQAINGGFTQNGTITTNGGGITIASTVGGVTLTGNSIYSAGKNGAVGISAAVDGAKNLTIDGNTVTTMTIGTNTALSNLTIDANFLTTGSVVTAGTLAIAPETHRSGTTMNIGASGGSALIDDSEIARLSAAAYVFGSANAGNITIDTGHDFGGRNVLFQSGGNVTLAGTLTASGGGNMTLVAGQNFTNSAATPFALTGGRWLVYSTSPGANSLGGLTTGTGGFVRYSCSYGGTCPDFSTETGNGFLYTVTPLLTVTPNAIAAITYGDAAPSLAGYAYTVKATDYLSAADQSADVVSGTLAGSTTYTQGSDVSSYGITHTGGTLTDKLGYGFTYAANPTAITVNKKSLDVTVAGQAITYGDAIPSTTFSYNGFVLGQGASVLDTAPTVASAHSGLLDAGTYTANYTASGGADNNYSFHYIAGDLVVAKKDLNVTAAPQAVNYGTAVPATTISYNGFITGEGASVLDTQPTVSSAHSGVLGAGTYAGNYTVAGGADNNYTLHYISGDLTINKAGLNVVAGSQSVTYGTAVPGDTYAITGFVNGDGLSVVSTLPTLGSARSGVLDAGTYAGNYTVAGAVAANYTFNYVAGTLTVTRKTLNVTANGQTITAGTPVPGTTISYNGFVNGDNAGVLDTAPTAFSARSGIVPGGTYAGNYTASGGADNDYDFNYIAGALIVTGSVAPTLPVGTDVPNIVNNVWLMPAISDMGITAGTPAGAGKVPVPSPLPDFLYCHDTISCSQARL
ncbi:MAG: MBG domain-containing protein [Alphaproteobacteria bacterium]